MSVRARIALVATVVVLLVLAAVSVALVHVQRTTLTHHLEQALTDEADTIEDEVRTDRLPTVITGLSDDDTIAQVIDANGALVAATANSAALPLAPPSQDGWGSALVYDDATQVRYRVYSRTVDGRVTIVIAANLDDVNDTVATLRRSLWIGVPGVTLVLALLVWWLAGRALRPVELMRRDVEQMGDAGERVAVPNRDDEIARLGRTMNSMLARVEASSAGQRRFVADAAHELRSPLARLRSTLEVDGDASGVLADVIGMQRLVDDLLALARSDAPSRRDPVDLDDLVLAEAARLRAAGRHVDTSRVSAAQVRGDRGQLARAVANLVENADHHARDVITLAAQESSGTAVVTVSDDGPGIPDAERERVFERFARLDGVRTPGANGAGLGLAIARSIAVAHGGTITADEAPGGGARFVLTVPIGGSPGDTAADGGTGTGAGG